MLKKHTAKYLAIVMLVGVGAFSWYFALSFYRNNVANIVLAVEHIAIELALPYHIVALSFQKPVKALPVPVYGVPLSEVVDSWGFARTEGRTHEGSDIFASLGTPVFSVTEGYVFDTYFGHRGGNNVMVVGPGGMYYYYAHFERLALGIERGVKVTPDTVLGYVGVSGNATGTPPHLHFGLYVRPWVAINPYQFFVERWRTFDE